ncbi:MAG TPA: nucleoid-associated protein [Clostridia bacterium]|nr:nucleoid-associated protein [Clostridia bacterium]
MEDCRIAIKKLIVHILDTSLQMPVISTEEHPIETDVNDYLTRHIIRILQADNAKNAMFLSDSKIGRILFGLSEEPERFLGLTGEIASILYDIMLRNVDIAPADLICALFELDGVPYFGMLKMNFRNTYIHYIENMEEGTQNKLIRQQATLPGDTQKIEECALVSLNDMSIRLIEKKYDINGEKTNYFSELFLQCSGDISDREKIRIFNKATDQFKEEYLGDDFKKDLEIRKAVSESFELNSAIDIEEVAANVFRNSPDMQKSYLKTLEDAGLKTTLLSPSEKVVEKNYRNQTLKTDTGIEINIPVECYTDRERIEFITNPDGTISILIKNVNKIF